MILDVAATAVGIGLDLLLCWLSWRFLVKPKLTKFIDKRIATFHEKHLVIDLAKPLVVHVPEKVQD
jgi:hypothetical protein